MTKNNTQLKSFEDLINFAEKAIIGLSKDRFEPSFLNQNYPPYNVIRKSENEFLIEMSVAGYAKEEIEIKHIPETYRLEITGEKSEEETVDKEDYIHRGLSKRKFRQSFSLGENVKIKEAKMENGLLLIYLERIVPEEKLPQTIEIK